MELIYDALREKGLRSTSRFLRQDDWSKSMKQIVGVALDNSPPPPFFTTTFSFGHFRGFSFLCVGVSSEKPTLPEARTIHQYESSKIVLEVEA